MNVVQAFKDAQKTRWASFAPLAHQTLVPAARLVSFAKIGPGDRVLDAACGTGVVAVTAARAGAHVTGLDLTPELLAQAQSNATTAGVTVDWHEGDVEQLPFPDDAFDVVISQFGHIFAPQPARSLGEMLRVLKPGGTIAFSTWPPELCVGRTFALVGRYSPPPPEGIASPLQWGVPEIIAERLGARSSQLTFDRGVMLVPALSLAHNREFIERTSGAVRPLVAALAANDPAKLQAFRDEYDAIVGDYYADNLISQGFLMTRAVKR